MSQVLVDAGVGSAGVVLPTLAGGYDTAWLAWNDAWRGNRQFSGCDAAEHIADAVERAYAGLPALTGVRPLILEAFAGQGEAADLLFLDGVADTLAALSERGIGLGIVCDVGFTPSPVLRRHLERHGLLTYFDHWSFSDEVGVYKPDPRIFQHALAGLGGFDPTRCVHVGDRRRTDVAGAQALGMRAVRITSVFDDAPDQGPEGDVVISSYKELLPALGLA